MVSGVSIQFIIESFFFCCSLTSGGIILNSWPNGKSLDEQPKLMVDMFSIIRDECLKWAESKSKTRK